MRIGFSVTPFNFAMRNRRAELGLTQADVADLCGYGVNIGTVGQVERLQMPDGNIDIVSDKLHKIANVLEMDFDKLFPREYLDAIENDRLSRENATFIWVREVPLDRLLETELGNDGLLAAAEDEIDREYLRSAILSILGRLSSTERQIIELRYGFGDDEPHTLFEIGEKMSMTRERVRITEAGALGKIRMAGAGQLREFGHLQ